MKKVTLLTILILATVGKGWAQQSQITWGNPFKTDKRNNLGAIVGNDPSGIYTISYNLSWLQASEVLLEHFDQDMNKVNTAKIDLESLGDGFYLHNVIHYNNRLFLFSRQLNKKDKVNTLYVQPIDKSSLQPVGKPEQVASVDYEGYRNSNSGNFELSISRDSTKCLVTYHMPYEKGESEKFGFSVLDYQLKPMWNKEIELPYKEELFSTQRIKVDDNGNVRVLGRIYDKKAKERRKGLVNYKYHMLTYAQHGNELQEYPIELGEKYITDLQFTITEDQNILCAGFYSENGTYSIKGSYFLTIDNKTKRVLRKSTKDFSIGFITETMRDRAAKKAEKKADKGKNVEMYQYDLDNLVLREDGGVVLIGEQFYISTSTSNVNGYRRTTTRYHFNDIILVNLNAKGDIDWSVHIPKRQMTTQDGGRFSSYSYAVVGDKLNFIYNENPKNFKDNGDKIYNANPYSRQAVVAMVEVNNLGEKKAKPLFLKADAEVTMMPSACRQINPNTMVVYGRRKKDQRFAKITFVGSGNKPASKK